MADEAAKRASARASATGRMKSGPGFISGRRQTGAEISLRSSRNGFARFPGRPLLKRPVDQPYREKPHVRNESNGSGNDEPEGSKRATPVSFSGA